MLSTINFAWGVGDTINQNRIIKWLDNFTGDALISIYNERNKARERERQLALFLLCNFVYYNENEIRHLIRLAFRKFVHSCCVSESKCCFSEIEINNLLKETKFTFLGDYSESSAYLLYLFRQENHLSLDHFTDIDKESNIVFIDDFSITGSQIDRYLTKKIKLYGDDKKYYILLLVTTESALEKIRKKHNIVTLPCIVLDKSSETFGDSSTIFSGYNAIYKEEAKKICEFYGAKLVKNNNRLDALGFGGKGFLFGVYYNVPNNTLPIFWSEENNWFSIFKRYEKEYNTSIHWEGHYV
jgi:hypothetical protein